MNILTLNTWGNCGPWEDRWNFFLEELRKLNPDLIFLQELKDSFLADRIQNEIGIKHLCANYESGLFIASRIPFIFQEHLKYKTQSSTEHEERRALICGIHAGNVEHQILIANTHLSWRTEDGLVRLAQVKELLEVIQKKGDMALLAGDFNDVPNSQSIKKVIQAGYLNMLELLHPGEANITWDNQNPFIQTHSVKFLDRQIDYLFANQNFLAQHPLETCEIVFNHPNKKGIYPSDHYGIFAEVA
ncbi:MAG: endonuclease/exonuclease/phosphatase family protein [Candidatus Omnitrophica bacterium]|nr:endonuclease/exonuclease/phosphatase family protein [Candidatus Omnitrophota bacterium]